MASKGELRLYVADHTSLSQRAIRNLKDVGERELLGQYELKIIDVLKDPQAAEDAAIIATPTLLRISPLPVRRLIGDLSDRTHVLRTLAFEDGYDPPGRAQEDR